MRKRKPKSAKQRAEEAEAQVRLESARLQLQRLKLAKKATRQLALSTHQAASRTRTTRDWRSPQVSADSEIIDDLPVLVARARQMVRDDAYAASIVRAFRRNVVGRGIQPSFAARGPDGKALDVFNRMADEAWYDWSCRAELVDVEKKRNFAQIQQWAISELIIAGEALVIWSYDESQAMKGACGLVLQCVESEQLNNTIVTHEGNEVRGGIEINAFGAPVAYHFWTRHPHDYSSGYYDAQKWQTPGRIPDEPNGDERSHANGGGGYPRTIRVEASRVMHIFDPERARQTRGVSRFRSVLMRLRDIGQFEYAELLKARAQACIGLVIKDTPTANWNGLGLENGDSDDTDADGNDELAMQPVMTVRLGKDEDVEPFVPSSPGNQFAPFMMAELRSVAAGVGLSYEQIARDFSQGTYSSQRQGMLEDRREYAPLQQLIIGRLCQPVLDQFVEWSVSEGRLMAAGFANMPHRYTYVEWMPDGWEWIDPAKEAQAAQIALEANLTTKQRVLLERGLDWREVARQRAEEKAFEAKVRSEAAAKAGVQPVAPVEEGEASEQPEPKPAKKPEPVAQPKQATSDGSDQSAENVVEGVKLNGAQITAAKDVIAEVVAKTLPPEVAIELLIAVGLEEDKARRMVSEASTFTPAKQPEPQEVPA